MCGRKNSSPVSPLHEFDSPRDLRSLRNRTTNVPSEFRLDSTPEDVYTTSVDEERWVTDGILHNTGMGNPRLPQPQPTF